MPGGSYIYIHTNHGSDYSTGGGDAFPPSILLSLVFVVCPDDPLTNKRPAPLRVPKINLVADYSPGGSPAGTPLRGPAGPRAPLAQGGRLPPPGDGGHLTDFVPN